MDRPDYAAQIAQAVGEVLALDTMASGRVAEAIRERFGGQRLRIEAVAPVTLEAVDAGLRERKPVAVIAGEVGVHRSTIYRLLGRKKSRPGGGCDTRLA